jgi:hypothetical protein
MQRNNWGSVANILKPGLPVVTSCIFLPDPVKQENAFRCYHGPSPIHSTAPFAPNTIDKMARAMAATELDDGRLWTYVEFKDRLYHVSWHESTDRPDFDHFPNFENATIQELTTSREMRDLLAKSDTLDYGADAWIRTKDGLIIKYAYPTQTSQARLRDEYRMLQYMSELSLPVPRLQGEPFTDADGIFAFGMERLYKWAPKDDQSAEEEMKRLMGLLHSSGICHNDLRQENVMQTKDGRTVMIDFGRSGRCGELVPWYSSSAGSIDQAFDFDTDRGILASYLHLKKDTNR